MTRISSAFERLAREGRTVFVSSHLMSEMELMAEHYVIVGNEPNRGDEWSDQPNPAEYARYLRDVGNALLESPAVNVVSFTGSTDVGRTVSTKAAPSFKKVHLEMGGKNIIVVMDDADLELAVDGCVWGGFGTTGQRCTASSRLIVTAGIHDRFVAAVADKLKTLRVDNALLTGTDIGPVVDQGQLDVDCKYLEVGQAEGQVPDPAIELLGGDGHVAAVDLGRQQVVLDIGLDRVEEDLGNGIDGHGESPSCRDGPYCNL